MKIAHIISTFPPYKGGMGNSVYYSAREMARLGHQNIIFTPAYNQTLPSHEILEKNLEVIRLSSAFSFGNAAVLLQLIWKTRGFDIVHLHYPFFGSGEMVMLGLLFTRAKFMLHYHMDTVGEGMKGIIFKLYAFFFLPIVVRSARLITCASIDYVKHSEIKEYYQTHKNKFVQIPFGVDSTQFSPGIKSEVPTILFVGGLDRQHNFKGVGELIEAFAKIAVDQTDSKLIIVGKGDLEDFYQNRIRSFDLESRISILNSVSDLELADLFKTAWATVLPSTTRAEAFGLVLLESLASGTAVIASNLAGVRSVFRNGQQGFLVKPGDVDDLAEKLQKIVIDKDVTIRMGKAGREWVETQFSWKKFSQRLEAAYCRVLYTPVPRHDENESLLPDDDE
jgi:glycosyltransferase involved in cell wall biosynthesis